MDNMENSHMASLAPFVALLMCSLGLTDLEQSNEIYPDAHADLLMFLAFFALTGCGGGGNTTTRTVITSAGTGGHCPGQRHGNLYGIQEPFE